MPVRAASSGLCAALLVLAGCGGDAQGLSYPRWPTDPVGMRLAQSQRGGAEAPEQRPEFVGDGRHRELLSRALHDEDDAIWPTEVVAMELSAGPLLVVRGLLERRRDVPLDPARFADEGFAGAALVPGEASEERVAYDVVRRTWSSRGDDVDLAGWLAALETYLRPFERVRYARIVPARVVLDRDRAEVELELAVNGVLADGGLRHDAGRLASTWVRRDVPPEPDGGPDVPWRCAELRPTGQFETLVSSGPRFVDRTLEAFRDTGDDPRRPQYLTNVHLGAAVCDVDGDGDRDIVGTQPVRVLLNRGDATFEDASERLGVKPDDAPVGTLAADFDCDGDVDLAFGGRQKEHAYLLVREGERFRRHELVHSLRNNISTSLSAHDVDADGFLDLFIAGYGSFGSPGPNDPSNATNGRMNQMLRGGPDLAFEDVTEAWGLAEERLRWCFIGAFGDADGDGDIDLYAANDWGPNVLYRRLDGPGVRFRAEVEPRETAEPGFSMSAMWADLDGDLDLDMYVSNMSSPDMERMLGSVVDPGEGTGSLALRRMLSAGNTVMRTRGSAQAQEADSVGARDALWAWGTGVLDVDQDGDLDVHVVNGFLSDGIDDGRDFDSSWWRHGLKGLEGGDPNAWPQFYAQYDLNSALGWSWAGFQRAVYFQNDGEAFRELGAVLGLDQLNDGRAVALGDMDGDGDPDVVGTSNNHPHLYLLTNESRPPGHFLWVDLVPAGNRSPAGASIVVRSGDRAWRRDVAIGTGYLAQNETAQHFGLGSATAIDRVEIVWPDGERAHVGPLTADRRIRVLQGAGGFEDVPLRQREPARGVPLIEWDAHRARVRAFRGREPDFARFELVALGGEPLALRGGTTLLVLARAEDPDLAQVAAAAQRIADVSERMRTYLLLVDESGGAPPEELRAAPAAAGVPTAVVGAATFREMLVMLRPWTGHLGLPLPTAVVLGPKGTARAASFGTVEPDHLRSYLVR